MDRASWNRGSSRSHRYFIQPLWPSRYRNTQLLGGKRTFVLSNAGHMQSILNPPGNKKSEFWTGGTLGKDPEVRRVYLGEGFSLH